MKQTFPIIYCQAFNNYTVFFYENGKNEVVSYTMKRFEAQFEKKSDLFLRLHRSWLVNKAYIQRVEKKDSGFQVIMLDGQEVPVSRRRYRLYAEVLRAKYVI